MGRSLRRMNHIKNIEMGRACGTYGDKRGAYRVLVTRPEGKRQLSRSRCRWEDNIKMDLQEVGWGLGTGLIWLRIGTGGGALVNGMGARDRTDLAQDRDRWRGPCEWDGGQGPD